MLVSLPDWIQQLAEREKAIQSRIFYIRLAALMMTPKGTLPFMSLRIGRNPNYLAHLIAPGRKPEPALLDYEDVIKIETMLTRDVMPRELLRPDIFVLPDRTP